MCCWRREYACPCAKYCACPIHKRMQLCRPLTEFRRTPGKRCPKGPLSEWDMWFKRNLKIIVELANAMDKPISEISELMYNFTLQNYSHMLNPEHKSWACRVPFARVDICESYLNIFDLDGNVRDPLHPKSLFQLLQVMQNILIGETPKSAGQQDICVNTELGKAAKTSNERLANINVIFPRHKDCPVYCYFAKCLEDNEVVKTSHMDTINIVKHRTGSKYITGLLADQRSSISSHSSDYLLMDKMGRRRGHGSKQLLTLRTEQRRILRNMLKKELNSKDSERFLEAIAAANLTGLPVVAGLSGGQAVKTISTFYSAVVSDPPKGHFAAAKAKQKAKLKKDTPTTPPPEDQIPPNSEPLRQVMYYGNPIPVLYHEPYDRDKQSTWIRRHPDQLRLMDDGQIAAGRTQRYKRKSIQLRLQMAGTRYSIHSINSVEPVEESSDHDGPKMKPLHQKSEYKRIFRSFSRHSKKPRH